MRFTPLPERRCRILTPWGGNQININPSSTPPGADFSLTYDTNTNTGSFQVGNANPYLLAGNLDPAVAWYDNGDQTWGSGDQFYFTFSSASGSLNGNVRWPGSVLIDFTNTTSPYGNADVVANAPVPEPATLSLLMLGGSALIGFRRRNSLKK